MATKIALQTQTLLGPKNLDPQILEELAKSLTNTEMCLIEALELDLINKLLQANCTSILLQENWKKATITAVNNL